MRSIKYEIIKRFTSGHVLLNYKKVLKMSFFRKSQPALELLLGLCIGLSISIILSPLIDNLCSDTKTGSAIVNFESSSSAEDTELSSSKSQVKPRPARPRFVSTELGIREKIFFGILTTSATLETRAVAINTTLNSQALKMTFFLTAEGSVQSQLPLVTFAKDAFVEDALWYNTLRYVGDQYLNTFDWFFFVPDSVYTSASNIINLVEHVSVAEKNLIGKPLQMERNGSTYTTCDTSVGVLMSNMVFSTLFQSLQKCMADSLSSCLGYISSVLNITCTNAINELNFNYYLNNSLNVAADLNELSTKHVFNKMMTIGLLKENTEFYKLHRRVAELEMLDTRTQLSRVNDEIIRVSPLTPNGNSTLSWPPGVNNPTQPRTRFDVQRWHYFTDTHIFSESDFNNYRELKGVDKEDVMDIVSVAIKRLTETEQMNYKYNRIVNGYRRFDSARGTDYILDLAVTPEVTNKEVVRRVELVRPLGAVEIIPTPYVTESTRVHLILPVTMNERDAVLAFLDSYSRVCVNAGDNADLLIVLIYPYNENAASDSDIYAVIKTTIGFYESRFKQRHDTRISWMPLYAGSSITTFEAMLVSFNIMDTVLHRFASESLVFVCSVGMELSIELLNRVRMNTIINFQVFFPIGFWAYKPNLVYDQPPYPADIEITSKSGRFDPSRYDHVSFYYADYTASRRQAAKTGYSPGDIYDLFIWYQPIIHVLRAVEPALRLQFREDVNCTSSESVRSCPSPRLPASQAQLALLVFEHEQRLDRQQLDVMHRQRGENVDQMKPDMI